MNFAVRNSRLCLCAHIRGSAQRHYKTVVGLKNLNFSTWDSRAQCFVSRSNADKEDNRVLKEMLQRYEALQREHDFQSGKELFEFTGTLERVEKTRGETARYAPPSITLEEWLLRVIADFRNPKRQRPTSSYQVYETLLTHLRHEGKLLRKPVSEMGDDSFLQLIDWVNKRPGKNGHTNNFVGILKIFRATLAKAKKAKLTDYEPDFPFMEYAPITGRVSERAADVIGAGGTIKSLTAEQYRRFTEMDVDDIIEGKGVIQHWRRELFRDFCIFLYEIKSRPIDVVKMHWENIALDSRTGKYTLTYIPSKKKNYAINKRTNTSVLVIQHLSPKALEIALKYKGRSKGGYIFPFAVNNRKWNLLNADEFHAYYNGANRACGRVNHFLHSVGRLFKLPFQLTIYAFRRTAITQAIIDNKIPLPILAKIAGTSLDMIDKHYTNYLHTIADY